LAAVFVLLIGHDHPPKNTNRGQPATNRAQLPASPDDGVRVGHLVQRRAVDGGAARRDHGRLLLAQLLDYVRVVLYGSWGWRLGVAVGFLVWF
jgi:hypothetical protein